MPYRQPRTGSARPAGGRIVSALTVLAMLVLSGCRLDVGADVVMAPDGSGTVTITAVADADLLARAPGALADLRLDDLKAGGWTVQGPAPADGGGQRLVVSKPFVTPDQGAAVLGELSGAGGPLRNVGLEWRRSFATVRSGFAATAGLEGGLAALGDTELTAALGGRTGLADRVTGDVGEGLKLSVTAHMPGRVTDSNGTVGVDRASVTWNPELRGNGLTELRATFAQRDSGALSARTRARWARIALVVWALALLVLAATIAGYVARSRRRRVGGASRSRR